MVSITLAFYTIYLIVIGDRLQFTVLIVILLVICIVAGGQKILS